MEEGQRKIDLLSYEVVANVGSWWNYLQLCWWQRWWQADYLLMSSSAGGFSCGSCCRDFFFVFYFFFFLDWLVQQKRAITPICCWTCSCCHGNSHILTLTSLVKGVFKPRLNERRNLVLDLGILFYFFFIHSPVLQSHDGFDVVAF